MGAAPLVDERDQIRGMQFAQTLALGNYPLVVKILEVVTAIERDRRFSVARSRQPLVLRRIGVERRIGIPTQRYLVGNDPWPLWLRIRQRA